MLEQATEVAPDGTLALSKSQAENAALRMALYETVKNDMTIKVSQPKPLLLLFLFLLLSFLLFILFFRVIGRF